MALCDDHNWSGEGTCPYCQTLDDIYFNRKIWAENPTQIDKPVVGDDTFMKNVRDALENGYDRLCAHCGVGVYDISDIHERGCPEYDAERAR